MFKFVLTIVLVALWFQPGVSLVSRIRPQDYVLLLSSCEKWIIIFINSSCWNAHSIDDIIYRLINSQYNALANIGIIDGVADKDYFSMLGFEKQTIQIRDPPCSNAYGTYVHPSYIQTMADSLQKVFSDYEDFLCQKKKRGLQISESCYFHVVFSPSDGGTASNECYNYYKELKRHFKGLYKFSIDPKKSNRSVCHVTVYGVDKDRPFEFDLDSPPGGPVMSIYSLSSFLRDYRASFEPCAITPDKINSSPYSGVTGLPSLSNQQTNCYHLKQLLGYSGSYPDAVCDNIAAKLNAGWAVNPAPSVVNYYHINTPPPYPSWSYPLYANPHSSYESQYPPQVSNLPGFDLSYGSPLGPLVGQLPVQPQLQQPLGPLPPQPVQQPLFEPVQSLMQPSVELPALDASRNVNQPEPESVPDTKIPEVQESTSTITAVSKEPGEQPSFLRYLVDSVVPTAKKGISNLFKSSNEALPPSVKEDMKNLKEEDLEKLFEDSGLSTNNSDIPEGSKLLQTPSEGGDSVGAHENEAGPKAGEKGSTFDSSSSSTSVSSSSAPEAVVTEVPTGSEVVGARSAGDTDPTSTLSPTAATLTTPPAPPITTDPAEDDILATDIESVMKDCKFWIILGTTDDTKKNVECSKKLLSIKPEFQKRFKFGGIYSKEFYIRLYLKNKSNPIMITNDSACNLDEVVKVLEDHKGEHPGEFCQDDDVNTGERSLTAENSTQSVLNPLPDTSPTTPRLPNSTYTFEFIEVTPPDDPVGLNTFENEPATDTPEPKTLPGPSGESTPKPLEVEVIYLDSLPNNTSEFPPDYSGILNSTSHPTIPTQRTLLQKIINLINFTEPATALPTNQPEPTTLLFQTTAFDVLPPTEIPESTNSPTVKRSLAPKAGLHKECKYQIILRNPDPESLASLECENALSTLVTSHDWALVVEPRNTFGVFLGSAGGIRDIHIPSVHECSIENVQKGVDELLKDPINKPLCVYVRAPDRG